ncbi:hypothetical protein COO60DRAFT_596836 [Scenedesmus sp. NREL 46B-D3]|nr:hypothetical protein COO60DRAFT_596836 [Scenedesmus sp. NREL 46B-D3]
MSCVFTMLYLFLRVSSSPGVEGVGPAQQAARDVTEVGQAAAAVATGAAGAAVDAVKAAAGGGGATAIGSATAPGAPLSGGGGVAQAARPDGGERDLCLAWSVKRSKAVNGTHAVVGVIGKGHLRGLVHALKHDQGSLRFADLVGGKNRKKSKAEAAAALGKRVLIEALIGAGVCAVWVAANQPGGLSGFCRTDFAAMCMRRRNSRLAFVYWLAVGR